MLIYFQVQVIIILQTTNKHIYIVCDKKEMILWLNRY